MSDSRLVRGSAWIAALAALVLGACSGQQDDALKPAGTGPSVSLADLMKERGLTEADVTAALKTYMPTGKLDDYYIFSSGGQSGQVMVVGIPSMRILKYIGVFTPEPWQGYGYGDATRKVLDAGNRAKTRLSWGDTHHPNLSETNGDYDGEFLFIGD
jgi:nitrous-oxide reductase